MINNNIDLISRAISKERLMDNIKNIIKFHRIQGSIGYRKSAEFIKDRLLGAGIKCEILKFPADYETDYLGMKAFKEWNCKRAYCTLIAPEEIKLCSYEENNISIFQKSYACDYSENPVDVVLLDKGNDESNYCGIDLKGKIIFVRDDFNAYIDWAIRKKGAIGIISDYVVENKARSRHDMYKNRKYTTFWWNKEEDIKPFGFVITPEQGDYLAKLCNDIKNNSDSKYPQVKCFMDAEFCDGFYEVVVADIPGETDEEIWVTAHLCHPKESANDNASGVSAAMETIRVISELIKQKKTERPKRTLKIILMPEFTGIYAYIDKIKKLDNVLAAINLDMVGGKQELGYGPLTVSGLAYSTPSFVTNLSTYILGEVKKEIPGFSPNNMVSLFNTAVCDFTEGSDHFILQDPTVYIPAPMLGQWPDKFYHTDGDSIETISEHILTKSAIFAASYAYTLCSLKEDDLESLLDEGIVNMTDALIKVLRRKHDEKNTDIKKYFEYISEFYKKSNEYIMKFFIGNEKVKCKVEEYNAVLEKLKDNILSVHNTEEVNYIELDTTYSAIPYRKYMTPINNLSEYVNGNANLANALKEYQNKYRINHKNAVLSEILIQYYINGVYSIGEIAGRVIFECNGGDEKAVQEYIFLLHKFDFIEFSEKEADAK